MIDIIKLIGIEPRGDHRLRLRFSDGASGEHDFASMLSEDGPMLAPLKDARYFARAFIEMGVLVWPNGLELDSIRLHDEMDAAGELRRDAA